MMNHQSPFSVVLGVDVSKAKLDCAFADGQETWTIDNTSQKILAELLKRITNPKGTIVVVEATGGYEEGSTGDPGRWSDEDGDERF